MNQNKLTINNISTLNSSVSLKHILQKPSIKEYRSGTNIIIMRPQIHQTFTVGVSWSSLHDVELVVVKHFQELGKSFLLTYPESHSEEQLVIKYLSSTSSSTPPNLLSWTAEWGFGGFSFQIIRWMITRVNPVDIRTTKNRHKLIIATTIFVPMFFAALSELTWGISHAISQILSLENNTHGLFYTITITFKHILSLLVKQI